MVDPAIQSRNRGNKRRGAAFEIALVDYLREKGYPAERISKKGRGDEGDVAVPLRLKEFLLVEAKNEASINLSGYVTEAAREAEFFESNRALVTAHPVAIVKRRQSPIGKSYVVMELDYFLRLLQ